MTITNLSDSIQSLLFDRPLKNYPWGTFAILIFDETHDTLSAKVNTEILSSTLYAKEDLKKTGAFYDLRPKQILKHTYRLADIAILKNYERTLKPGKYHFFLQYYINKSNEATFTIKK
ncbi:MAG: hypothetical protein ABIP30_05930 [Ferruginibacter sp.]